MKKLLITLLFAPLTVLATEPHKPPVIEQKPKDNWAGAGLHISVSAVAGLACRAHLYPNEPLKAFGCAMVPGLIKETLDSQQKGNRFSTKDMISNAVGAAIGVTVGGFTITPNSITYQSTF